MSVIGNLLRGCVGPGNVRPKSTDQQGPGSCPIVQGRFRVPIADVNAGVTLVAAIPGYKLRMTGCRAIAVGGAAGSVTTVDILATQGAASVKLVAFAQASLTQSASLSAGASGATILADGASFAQCDANTAITIGKTGSAIDTATAVDILLDYVAELA